MTDPCEPADGETVTDPFGHYDAEFVPTLVPELESRQIGDEAVVWPAGFPRPTYVDPIARVLLGVIDGKATMAELLDDIEAVFAIERALAAAQLARVVGVLDSGGLLDSSMAAQIFAGDPPLGPFPEPDF